MAEVFTTKKPWYLLQAVVNLIGVSGSAYDERLTRNRYPHST
ncbi:hypothetical protein VCHC61A2_2145 [Vibrio cholerae HC-61A2]|nr:hypothetical protein VCHC02A1_3536 [Vibrio cholerae HC-02A1]EHH74237.1 hypothetical protein VCHC06A1_0799 [Vibrio cholerae HC-06A1]EHH94011.1 hypothetical protein VCHC33A2_3238 [Vibrio cholerae HC-33A2]EJH33088.1 hypothetical protein VCCP104114_1460 [Vibrio cholerae CP1041(14)]EJH51937.1 hypothetical protein VCHC20A2_2064 [Vibrio cholerae HC-20A2]EKG44639.1 hypothetical protein VCHC41A1_3513 [Vibrio cholerae HC-41A1]EKL22100.1 hypothetical protein VCHC61A2_2145 [Vibrio cholerae HC-61A2]